MLYFLAFKAKTFITFLTLFLWTSTVFYFILFYLIFSYLSLAYLILSYLILSFIIYSHLFSSNLFLSNLDFAFASLTGLPVIRNLCGRFKAGQITAIIGPSGAGKTSLLSLLRGQTYYATITGVLRVSGYSKISNLQYKLVRKIQCDYFFILL